MLRVLKLYVVVNDKNIYELKEQQPVVIDDQPLPVKLMAKNGYHFSKPVIITSTTAPHILIGVGCEADNGRFWGGIVLSTWLFVIFFLTKLYVVLFLANLPLLYLIFKFFWLPKRFITIEQIKK